MSYSDKRKIAVITGSTKGIGKSIGLTLLREGCYVIFNYAASNKDAEALYNELQSAYAGNYEIIKSNLSEMEGVESLTESILRNHQSIDYLILNAGTTSRTSLRDISLDEWNRVLNTNLTMPLFLIQKLSKHITDGGRIIFIGSLMGKYPHSMSISYGVSKAGVHMLSRYLVKEFAERKITINTIIPGFVDTPWQKNKPAEIRQSIENKVALGRFAEPEEIAKVCLSIIENQYINGAEIVVDGGYCYQ